jgi:hypothetical protein
MWPAALTRLAVNRKKLRLLKKEPKGCRCRRLEAEKAAARKAALIRILKTSISILTMTDQNLKPEAQQVLTRES